MNREFAVFFFIVVVFVVLQRLNGAKKQRRMQILLIHILQINCVCIAMLSINANDAWNDLNDDDDSGSGGIVGINTTFASNGCISR